MLITSFGLVCSTSPAASPNQTEVFPGKKIEARTDLEVRAMRGRMMPSAVEHRRTAQVISLDYVVGEELMGTLRQPLYSHIANHYEIQAVVAAGLARALHRSTVQEAADHVEDGSVIQREISYWQLTLEELTAVND